MGVIKVNSGGHTFNKPIWIKTAVKGRYMLYGALTQKEINKLDQLMPSINEPIDLLKIENPYKRDKEEFEQWENSAGKKIKAAVQEIEGDRVLFLLPNGKALWYDISKLSESSQSKLKDAD